MSYVCIILSKKRTQIFWLFSSFFFSFFVELKYSECEYSHSQPSCSFFFFFNSFLCFYIFPCFLFYILFVNVHMSCRNYKWTTNNWKTRAKTKKEKITEANVCKSKKHYHRKMLKKHQKKGKVSRTYLCLRPKAKKCNTDKFRSLL